MRQPTRISPRPVYGLPAADGVEGRSGSFSVVLALLLLTLGLAVATVWYVALPAFDEKPQVERSCEVIVLESGATRCVVNPVRASRVGARLAHRATAP